MVNVMEEVHLTTIKPRNNVLLLAQEISFAKVLACNDKRLRDRGVKRLKKWFMARSQGSVDFTKEDHMRIWKGLFYCMWMSDKPLIQEELAEEISNLIQSFATFKASLLFVETFFTSLSVEWFGIDQLRLDKFMMLVRRFMRQSFELVARMNWPEKEVQELVDVYQTTLCNAPMGLCMHVIEVFCEELAKVGKGELSSSTILQFMAMFARVLATLKDGRLISQITRFVFLHLIRQTELGVEHHMKFSAWKQYGFPGGDLDAAEKMEVDSESEEETSVGSEEDDAEEEEEEEKVGVDARAGRVNVLLPPLDFEPQDLVQVLKELRNKKNTTTKARKTLIQLINKYESLAAGKYPLGIHKVDLPKKIDKKKEITKAAKSLIVDEAKLLNSEDDSDEEGVKSSSNNKKNKINLTKKKKKKGTVWNVSDTQESEQSGVEKGSDTNTSWEISDSHNQNEVESQKSVKRKLKEKNPSSLSDSITKAKKPKLSSFSVCDSKENSFSSPVASTPNNLSKSNVLEKVSPNRQNIQKEANVNTTGRASKNKLKTSNKNQINNQSCSSETKGSKKKIQRNADESTPKSTKDLDSDKKEELILNASSTPKNNGWGGEWDEPLQNGEYEIFIPNKKYVDKRKSLGLPYPVSSITQNSGEKVTPINKLKNVSKVGSTPGSQKKVEFNMSANRSQDYGEYTRTMKSNKKQIPFDASKKPTQGLLKNSTPSPINPFYKNKLKLFSSPNIA